MKTPCDMTTHDLATVMLRYWEYDYPATIAACERIAEASGDVVAAEYRAAAKYVRCVESGEMLA